MAHLAITHCCFNPGAVFLIGRRAMPDLKRTLYKKILRHMGQELIEGQDYFENKSLSSITFRNKSQIISTSWADSHFEKVRSLDISAVALEELTENDDIDFYTEIKMRVGRVLGINEKFIISATNPGSPASCWYDYFEMPAPTSNTKHIFYSVTTDNPFLPKEYVAQLKKDLDPKMAQRMLYGQWIDLRTETIYYAYDTDIQYLKDKNYEVSTKYPIHISFDFNIADGKPMSVVCLQYIDDIIHIFDETTIEGYRTNDALDEIAGKEILNYKTNFIVNGDASGRAKDTRNIKSDYDLIRKYLENYCTPENNRIRYEVDVPLSNPPIRKRHNLVNAYCKNENGEVRLFLYRNCKMSDKGLRLTSLKESGSYVEDDSKEYQHVTTAIGYAVCAIDRKNKIRPQATIIL